MSVAPAPMQAVPPLADPVMLLSVLAVLALLVAATVQLMVRRGRPVLLSGSAMLLVGAYLAALIGVALATPGVDLATGQAKCFDDWCVAYLDSEPQDGSLQVHLMLENRGAGRPMRSNLARAYLETGDGTLAPRDSAPLHELVSPGSPVPISITFATASPHPRLVVSEAGDGLGPGSFEIGGDSSLLHRPAAWRL